jgi:hypothetical protein
MQLGHERLSFPQNGLDVKVRPELAIESRNDTLG